jgi:hypothetical protein
MKSKWLMPRQAAKREDTPVAGGVDDAQAIATDTVASEAASAGDTSSSERSGTETRPSADAADPPVPGENPSDVATPESPKGGAGKSSAETDDALTTSDCPIEELEAFRLDAFYPGRVHTTRHRRAQLLLSKDLTKVWAHIHPDPANSCWLAFAVHEGEIYPVGPKLQSVLKDQLGYGRACLVLTTQGVLGVWWLPRSSPGKSGRSSWNDTALEIAEEHAGGCVRMHTVKGPSVYEAEVAAPGTTPEPEWPDVPFMRRVEEAFGPRMIHDEHHPVARILLAKTVAK